MNPCRVTSTLRSVKFPFTPRPVGNFLQIKLGPNPRFPLHRHQRDSSRIQCSQVLSLMYQVILAFHFPLVFTPLKLEKRIEKMRNHSLQVPTHNNGNVGLHILSSPYYMRQKLKKLARCKSHQVCGWCYYASFFSCSPSSIDQNHVFDFLLH